MWGNTNFRHIIYAHSMPTTIVPTGKQVTQLTKMKTRAVNIILLIHLNPKCTGNSMGNLNSSNKNDARNWASTHCVFFLFQKSEYALCEFLYVSGFWLQQNDARRVSTHCVRFLYCVLAPTKWCQKNEYTSCKFFLSQCVLARTKRHQKSEYTLFKFS